MATVNCEAIPCVLQLLHHHESPRIKAAAADALGRIGTHHEFDDLLNARQSQSRQVRMAARTAIQRIRFRQSYCAYRHLLRPAAAHGQSVHEMLRPAHTHAEHE
jgi:HEAT repeat protein